MRKQPDNQQHDKKALNAKDGERIDLPRPADDGASRGAREDLEIAYETEERAKRDKAGARDGAVLAQMLLSDTGTGNPGLKRLVCVHE